MKNTFKRFFGAMLAAVILITMFPAAALPVAATPASAQSAFITGDIIEFGSYPQTRVTDAGLIASLNTLTPDTQGDVDFGGDRYKRIYFTTVTNAYQALNGYDINTVYWFKYEPIEWRVLSDTNGELFVVAEKILQSKQYNSANIAMTWENCGLRSWLNSDFYNNAFNSVEKIKVLSSDVVNENNPDYGTSGGNNTQDKLFLLSLSETVNSAYGFSSAPSVYDTARRAGGTDFAKSSGLYVATESSYAGNSYWWLRSPGMTQQYAGYVNYYGTLSSSTAVDKTYVGIRPALKINKAYDTGEIIEYGSYPQTKVADAGLIAELNAQTPQADNTVTYNGSKYLKQTDWFKYERIEWRVLSNTNDELFVLAEKILDCKPYYPVFTGVTWENCTLRAWLNNNFFSTAFSPAEAAKIQTSLVINDDDPWGTDGGNNTNDKLFLLSFADVTNPAYGFNSSNMECDTARMAQGSDFAKNNGLYVSTDSSYLGNSYWWLRTHGNYQVYVCYANMEGNVNHYISTNIHDTYVGVRPVLRVKLSPDIITPVEGSGCVIDRVNMQIYGLAAGLTSLQGFANVAAGYALSYVPTANGFGTGTVVNVTLGGETVESYTILIFGDVNGDCTVDSIDAGTMVDHENYLITWDTLSDAVYIKAADLNGDSSVDSIDAGITVDAENYMVTIDQSTGLAI